MLAIHQNGAIKKFGRTPWRFQQTFQTPLKSLEPFAGTILGAIGDVGSGTVTIDAVVFEPKKLQSLLGSKSIRHVIRHDSSFVTESASETQALLVAAFGGWVDFLFLPSPKPFIIYADHDEYATFYANTKSNLNAVTSALTKQGFRAVRDYVRNV